MSWGMGIVLGGVVYVLTGLIGIRLTLAIVVTFGFVWLWNTVVMVGLIVARLAERGLVDKAELEL